MPTRRPNESENYFPERSSRLRDCRDLWFEDKNDCESDLTESFFADSQKNRQPGKLHVLKVALLSFLKEVEPSPDG